MIEIKRATIDDIETLMSWRMEVLCDVFSIDKNADLTELTANNREYYLRELPTEGHIACFAYKDGQIAGCGGICIYNEMPSPDNPSGMCAYLMNIYTRPMFRGQGIGRKTASWLIKQAEEKGITKIYLEASDSGKPMYQKMGFSPMVDYLKLDQNKET